MTALSDAQRRTFTTDVLAQGAPAEHAGLDELQQWMARLLRHPTALAKSPAMTAAAALHFAGSHQLSPVEQLDIYRRQYWLRHTSVLIEQFPGLTRLIDQETWQPVVESYLLEHGASTFDLSDLGQHLARFLHSRTELQHQALCIDMAKLEWAYQEAFIAIDDPKLSQARVASIPRERWPDALLVISQSVHLLELCYPAHDLRRTLRRNHGPTELEACLALRGVHHLVVYRRDNTLWDKAISRPAFLLLTYLQAGYGLMAACEAAVHDDPEAARVFDTELTAWFALWGELGWIVDVQLPDGEHATSESSAARHPG